MELNAWVEERARVHVNGIADDAAAFVEEEGGDSDVVRTLLAAAVIRGLVATHVHDVMTSR